MGVSYPSTRRTIDAELTISFGAAGSLVLKKLVAANGRQHAGGQTPPPNGPLGHPASASLAASSPRSVTASATSFVAPPSTLVSAIPSTVASTPPSGTIASLPVPLHAKMPTANTARANRAIERFYLRAEVEAPRRS